METFNALVFIAPPLGGKDTQSNLFMNFCKENSKSFLFLTTGNEFRSLGEHNYTSLLLRETIASGNFVPDFIVNGVVASYLLRNFDPTKIVIFNGFPRNKIQGKEFIKIVEFYKIIPKVIYIKPSDKILMKRREIRHIEEQRSDDTLESFCKRIEIYKNQTRPLIRFLRLHFEIIEIPGILNPEKANTRILESLGLITKL